MSVPKSFDLWTLADSLNITLQVDRGLIRGQGTMKVTLGGLDVAVPVKVVSSMVLQTGPVLICRSLGNLAILIASNYKSGARCTLWLLDLAKMSAPEGLLEVRGFASTKAVLEAVLPAVVQTFDKDSKDRWHQVE